MNCRPLDNVHLLRPARSRVCLLCMAALWCLHFRTEVRELGSGRREYADIAETSSGPVAGGLPLAGGLSLTLLSRLAEAATPKDTVVIASQIDDLITLDPGEEYEISGQILVSNIYDRLVRYEAEDLTKLVGAVAESWEVGKDNKTFTFKLRPNQKFESGAVVTADDVAWSLQRVVLDGQDAGLPLQPARLEEGQRQAPSSRRLTPRRCSSRSLRTSRRSWC